MYLLCLIIFNYLYYTHTHSCIYIYPKNVCQDHIGEKQEELLVRIEHRTLKKTLQQHIAIHAVSWATLVAR